MGKSLSKYFCVVLISAFGTGPSLLAQSNSDTTADWMKVEAAPRPEAPAISYEGYADYSYVGGGRMDQGNRRVGNMDEQQVEAAAIASIPVAEGWNLRAGFGYDRYSFGLPSGSQLPNTLQSVAAVLGFDAKLSDRWLMRFEIHPGVYSDFQDVTLDDVNVPILLGFTYIVDEKLQWFFGLSADPRFATRINNVLESPVFPGLGVRWQFSDQWILMAVLPNPEIQFNATEQLQWFAGARLMGGTYRVAEDFGDRVGDKSLNNETVAYREIRVGTGLRYHFSPAVSIEAEGGWAVDRSFQYQNDDGLTIDGGGAAYGQLAVKTGF